MLSAVIVGVIVIMAFVGYAFYTENNSLNSLSQQNSSLGQQNNNLAQQVSVLQQHTVQVVTMTNTIVSVETSITVSTTTHYITSTVYSTVTSTRSVFPPSSSSYALTYVTGNSTWTSPNCGSDVVTVDVTYELHQQLPSTTNIIQWAQFPSGQLVQPSSQKEFISQAYLTIFSEYDYGSSTCGGGQITSLHAFVTDTNNNQLSPSTYFVVQG